MHHAKRSWLALASARPIAGSVFEQSQCARRPRYAFTASAARAC